MSRSAILLCLAAVAAVGSVGQVIPVLTGTSPTHPNGFMCASGGFYMDLDGSGFVSPASGVSMKCQWRTPCCANTRLTDGIYVSATVIRCFVPRALAYQSDTEVSVANNGACLPSPLTRCYSNFIPLGYTGNPGWIGPVFLNGHDPDFHAQYSQGAKNLFSAAMDYVTRRDWKINNGNKFLWVESRDTPNPTPASGHLIGANSLLNIFGLTEGVHFDWVSANRAISHAKSKYLQDVSFFNYTAVCIASTFGGTLSGYEILELNSRKREMEGYLKAGGGVFASSAGGGSMIYLTAGPRSPRNILQTEVYNYMPTKVTSINPAPPFRVTPYGRLLHGLVDGDVNDPTHNSFGFTGGLNAVDLDSGSPSWTTALSGSLNPCPNDCNYPQGICVCGGCQCNAGWEGEYCECQVGQPCNTNCGNGVLNANEECDSSSGGCNPATCQCNAPTYEATDPKSLQCQLAGVTFPTRIPNFDLASLACVPGCPTRSNCHSDIGGGTCTSCGVCSCTNANFGGLDCAPRCNLRNNCTLVGACVSPNVCDCPVGYAQPDCSPVCTGVNNCNGQGTCVAADVCACNSGYDPPACLPSCANQAECGSNQLNFTITRPCDAAAQDMTAIERDAAAAQGIPHYSIRNGVPTSNIVLMVVECNTSWVNVSYNTTDINNNPIVAYRLELQFVGPTTTWRASARIPHGTCIGPNTCNCTAQWTGFSCMTDRTATSGSVSGQTTSSSAVASTSGSAGVTTTTAQSVSSAGTAGSTSTTGAATGGSATGTTTTSPSGTTGSSPGSESVSVGSRQTFAWLPIVACLSFLLLPPFSN